MEEELNKRVNGRDLYYYGGGARYLDNTIREVKL